MVEGLSNQPDQDHPRGRGHPAYVPVGVADTANYPSSLCRAASISALRVANTGNHVVVGTPALRTTVCTTTQSLHTQSASLNPNF